MDWIADAARRLLAGDDLVRAERLALAASSGGEAGALAYLELCRLVGEAADPAEAMLAADDAPADATGMTGAMIVHGFAAMRATYEAQPDAVVARTRLADRAEAAYPAVGAALGHKGLDFAVRLAGQAIMELSRIAAARAPLVRVETGISLPSSTLAFDLYGDPSRGSDIMARNRCGTPALMPAIVEALAS